MKMKSKALLAVICAVLLVGATMFGTLAYLFEKTSEVTNTFIVGNLGVTLKLEENDVDKNEDGDLVFTDELVTKVEYTVAPCIPVPKNPFIHTSDKPFAVDAFLFMEVVDETGGYINFEIDENWTELTGVNSVNGGTVYYYNKGAIAAGTALSDENDGDTPNITNILKGRTVTPDETVDKDTEIGNLVFYGYAVQAAGFEAKDGVSAEQQAWVATYGAPKTPVTPPVTPEPTV